MPVLHLPLDFERREDVRRFARFVGRPDLAVWIVLKWWLDWARAGVEFRILKYAPRAGAYPWKDDDLTFVIEDECGTGKPGELITHAIAATVLRIEQRGAVWGLVLNDFWRFNYHLSPEHKTIQQKGAIAKHSRQEARALEAAAKKQAVLIQQQGQMVFASDVSASQDEANRSIALVMRLDRACGKPLRTTTEYLSEKALMSDALRAIRKYSKEEINRVIEHVIANRENPRMVKVTERLIVKFGELLGKASHGG